MWVKIYQQDGKVTTGEITLSLHNQGYIDAIEIPTELRNKGFAEKILPPLQKILKKELNGNIYFKTLKQTKTRNDEKFKLLTYITHCSND